MLKARREISRLSMAPLFCVSLFPHKLTSKAPLHPFALWFSARVFSFVGGGPWLLREGVAYRYNIAPETIKRHGNKKGKPKGVHGSTNSKTRRNPLLAQVF